MIQSAAFADQPERILIYLVIKFAVISMIKTKSSEKIKSACYLSHPIVTKLYFEI